MTDSTVIIKNYNKVIVPKDTIIIVPSKPEITLIQPTQDYSWQAWGLLLVILVIGILFYIKKQPKQKEPITQPVFHWGSPNANNNLYTNVMPADVLATSKIKIDEAKPKINLSSAVGESSLTAETTKTTQDNSIKDNIKKLRNK